MTKDKQGVRLKKKTKGYQPSTAIFITRAMATNHYHFFSLGDNEKIVGPREINDGYNERKGYEEKKTEKTNEQKTKTGKKEKRS